MLHPICSIIVTPSTCFAVQVILRNVCNHGSSEETGSPTGDVQPQLKPSGNHLRISIVASFTGSASLTQLSMHICPGSCAGVQALDGGAPENRAEPASGRGDWRD